MQKHPVRFGAKRLYISCENGGPKIKSVTINGQPMNGASPDEVALLYDQLANEAKVEIVTAGGWEAGSPARFAAANTAARGEMGADSASAAKQKALSFELSASLKKPYAVLTSLDRWLAQDPDAAYERAFVRESLGAIDAWRARTSVEPGVGFFRPMTPEKRAAILKFYENTALGMYNGFAKRMAGYAKSPNANQRRLAALFQQVQGN